jgi:hypothetical protein
MMVWGMPLPSSGGPYGPYGDFEGGGWTDRLRAYYNEKMSEEEKLPFKDAYGGGAHSYPFFAWGKFVGELGTKDSPDALSFTPIESHEPATFFSSAAGYKALASIISLPGRVWAVDEPTKAVVERLEPGVHEFYPIEIRFPRGKVYPSPYYVLVIRQYIDSLVPEKCKEGALGVTDHYKKAITGRAFLKAKFGKAHLWRDRAFREWMACMSDELHDELDKMGLLLPKQYPMIEI